MPKNNEDTFKSVFREIKEIQLPAPTNLRVMMLPVIIGDAASVPDLVAHWKQQFIEISNMADTSLHGKVGYLTIDEKKVKPKSTHRRGGLHVDGVHQGGVGGWGGGNTGASHGSVGNGMLTVSNPAGCRAWSKDKVYGWPGMEGECDHLSDQFPDEEAVLFKPNMVYWVDGLCVHESMPQAVETMRQFVRLSLPSEGPWFEGYTVNPLGIKPTGPILPRREFMSA